LLVEAGKAVDMPNEPTMPGFIDYLRGLATYDFCIAPRGVGIDTHRFWEALYMGCIPVITRTEYLECFNGLPMLLIENWEDFLVVDLPKVARVIRSRFYDMRPLSLSFWVQQAELFAMWG
jgi:hypothetical protein